MAWPTVQGVLQREAEAQAERRRRQRRERSRPYRQPDTTDAPRDADVERYQNLTSDPEPRTMRKLSGSG